MIAFERPPEGRNRRRLAGVAATMCTCALLMLTMQSTASAEPATTGSIAGTVRGPDGQPLGPSSGFCVGVGTQNNWSTLGAGGTYVIGDLAPGSYAVQFSPCSGGASTPTSYAPEFYPNLHSPDVAESTALPNVAVQAGVTTSGIDATLERGGELSLTVVDADAHPRSGLCVTARSARARAVRWAVGRFAEVFGATTDSNGRAVLNSLPEDDYTFEVQVCDPDAPGDLPWIQYSGGGFVAQDAARVRVSMASTTAITFPMARAAVITGQITHDGQPWAHGGVSWSSIREGGGCTPTDADGRFRIDGLTPTAGYLLACDVSDPLVQLPPTWYPAAASRWTASKLQLQAGVTSQADLELHDRGTTGSYIITGLPSSSGCGVRITPWSGGSWTVPIRVGDEPGVHVADVFGLDGQSPRAAELVCHGTRVGVAREATAATPQFNYAWFTQDWNYPNNLTSQIAYDVTGPAITPSPNPATMNWSNVPVTVSFSCVDAVVAVASCPAPVSFAEGQAIWVSARDVDGNVSWLAVSPRVDSTPPTITVTGNGRTFKGDEPMQFACDAADDRSGIAWVANACPAWGTPASALGVGTHTYQVTTSDWAGNTFWTTATVIVK